MKSHISAWLACGLLLAAFTVRAEDAKPEEKKGKKEEPARFWPRGPEVDVLKKELELSDDQVKQAKDAVAVVQKKNEELEKKAEVAAAEEELKKAKEALKAAEDKAKAAKDNFDLLEEQKKAVLSAIPEDKKAKAAQLIHYNPPKAPAAKKDDKKAEKKDEKKDGDKKEEKKEGEKKDEMQGGN